MCVWFVGFADVLVCVYVCLRALVCVCGCGLWPRENNIEGQHPPIKFCFITDHSTVLFQYSEKAAMRMLVAASVLLHLPLALHASDPYMAYVNALQEQLGGRTVDDAATRIARQALFEHSICTTAKVLHTHTVFLLVFQRIRTLVFAA
jgi:hypothetical protein